MSKRLGDQSETSGPAGIFDSNGDQKMIPIQSKEDLIQRGSRLPFAEGMRVAKMWKAGRCAEAIEIVEAAVPEPVEKHT